MEKILDLMKRMGENISPLSFWDKMIDENPIIIKEGLITSYNGEMVLNAICDSFHLRKNGQTKISIEPLRGTEYIYIGDAYITKENEEEIIKVRLDANEDFIDIIKKRLEKYGWNLFRKDKDENNKYTPNWQYNVVSHRYYATFGEMENTPRTQATPKMRYKISNAVIFLKGIGE